MALGEKQPEQSFFTGVIIHVGKIMVLIKYLCFSIDKTDVEKFLKMSECLQIIADGQEISYRELDSHCYKFKIIQG